VAVPVVVQATLLACAFGCLLRNRRGPTDDHKHPRPSWNHWQSCLRRHLTQAAIRQAPQFDCGSTPSWRARTWPAR
jgi:hypothetical protein